MAMRPEATGQGQEHQPEEGEVQQCPDLELPGEQRQPHLAVEETFQTRIHRGRTVVGPYAEGTEPRAGMARGRRA